MPPCNRGFGLDSPCFELLVTYFKILRSLDRPREPGGVAVAYHLLANHGGDSTHHARFIGIGSARGGSISVPIVSLVRPSESVSTDLYESYHASGQGGQLKVCVGQQREPVVVDSPVVPSAPPGDLDCRCRCLRWFLCPLETPSCRGTLVGEGVRGHPAYRCDHQDGTLSAVGLSSGWMIEHPMQVLTPPREFSSRRS